MISHSHIPHAPLPFSISWRMSSTRQTVRRGPSFIDLGKRPVLTPAHHVDLDTGIIEGIDGIDLWLPII